MEINLEERLDYFKNNLKKAVVPCFVGNAAYGYLIATSKSFDITDITNPLVVGAIYPALSMVCLAIKDKDSKVKLHQLIDKAVVPAVKYLNTSAIAGYALGYIGGKLQSL